MARRLPAGTHVSGSGSFLPDRQEIGSEVVTRARVVVEEREAALEEAGDLIVPIGQGLVTPDVIDADLGEIVNGDAPEGSAGPRSHLLQVGGNRGPGCGDRGGGAAPGGGGGGGDGGGDLTAPRFTRCHVNITLCRVCFTFWALKHLLHLPHQYLQHIGIEDPA